jgi:DnaK suppressor protein
MVDNAFLHCRREQLEAERTALEAELSRLRSLASVDDKQSEHAGMGNHMADDASEVFEQEKNLALERHTDQLLSEVQSALHRISSGVYGICESCGKPIDPERLETLPYAARCMECKTRQEKI